jgi:hypothetical protein
MARGLGSEGGDTMDGLSVIERHVTTSSSSNPQNQVKSPMLTRSRES